MTSSSASLLSGNSHTGLPLIVVVLSALCIFFCYCDRVNISVAIIEMSDELGWDKATQGRILGAFYMGYVLSQIATSVLSMWYGARRVLVFAAVGWSCMTLLTPTAAGYSVSLLVGCRVLLGLFEGAAFPAVYAVLGESAPLQRSRNIGMVHTGVFAGTVFAFVMSGLLVGTFGWTMPFYVFGVIDLLWISAWIKYAQPFHPATSPPHLLSVKEDQHPFSFALLLRVALLPECLPIFVAHICHAWAHFTLLAWLPSYLHDTGSSSSHAHAALIGPYLGMAAVNALGSRRADLMIEQGMERTKVRRLFGFCGFGGAAVLLLIFVSLPPGPMASFFLTAALSVVGLTPSGMPWK